MQKMLLSFVMFAFVVSCGLCAMGHQRADEVSDEQIKQKLEEMYNQGKLRDGSITVVELIKTKNSDGSYTTIQIPRDERVGVVGGVAVPLRRLRGLVKVYESKGVTMPFAAAIAIANTIEQGHVVTHDPISSSVSSQVDLKQSNTSK